jgi:ribosomal protein S18 acetylase RimI-like enzyme
VKIVSFDELESEECLLPLLDQAFRWTFNPRTFRKFVRLDPRLRNSGVGFCALDGSRLVGNVGVMDLTTKTLDGKVEHAGGIYGVATLPGYTRKGICSALMNRAHEHFRERGYRFSLLGTSHTIVAHSLYVKLGYSDLFEARSAYKVMKAKSVAPKPKEKAARLDVDKLLKTYEGLVGGKAGFVVRDRDHFVMFEKAEGIKGRNCMVGRDGYVLFSEVKQGSWMSGIWIRELVASRAKEMDRLVGLAEAKAKDMIYDRAVMDDTLLQVYRSRGYMTEERSHSVLMVKPLMAKASFRQTYGDGFHMTGLDFF